MTAGGRKTGSGRTKGGLPDICRLCKHRNLNKEFYKQYPEVRSNTKGKGKKKSKGKGISKNSDRGY